jgi:hypothetical protein
LDKIKADHNNENHQNNIMITKLKDIENCLNNEINSKLDKINQLKLEKNEIASELEKFISKLEMTTTEH